MSDALEMPLRFIGCASRMSSLPSLRLRKMVRPTGLELDVACNCRKSPTVISSGGTSLAATTTFESTGPSSMSGRAYMRSSSYSGSSSS